MGIYLGPSPLHAQTIPLILNLKLGLVSPQYHVIYDDQFTVTTSWISNKLPMNWEDLFKQYRENVLEGKDGLIKPTTEMNVLTNDWNVPTVAQPSLTSPIDCHFQTIVLLMNLMSLVALHPRTCLPCCWSPRELCQSKLQFT